MSRLISKSVQLGVDLLVLSLALFVAFELRFDWEIPAAWWQRFVLVWPYVVAFEYALVVVLGIHRFAWRYIGLREINRIAAAALASGFVILSARYMGAALADNFAPAQMAVLPLGVILNNVALMFLGLSGVRVSRRIWAEHVQHRQRQQKRTQNIPTLLVGAGRAGVMIAREIAQRPDIGIRAVGFLDDDGGKLGTEIHGVQVLGTTDDLVRLAVASHAEQVLISIAQAPGPLVRKISDLCEQAGLPVKIVPGLYEILDGNVNLAAIRDVAIEDLLGRDPVVLDNAALKNYLFGRTILVTGAAGSIGSELCRQVAFFGPSRLVLVDQWETGLFNIHRELLDGYRDLDVAPEIADICDAQRLKTLFAKHRPHVVLHAAAYKHVPMMEWNVAEAIKNNVLGSRTLADVAHEAGVREFVMISTDKAVNPSSVMGATKRLAEMYTVGLGQTSPTRFVAVRFGNVLGSAGSVVPIFKEQIAKGGPVTITDPNMQRYFMTIPEACQLVLQAATMGKGGEIFILDMGKPVKIVDLARDLIRLSGFRSDQIAIRFTGTRPGEKLMEELSTASEGAAKTLHPKIYVAKGHVVELGELGKICQDLATACVSDSTPHKLRGILERVVPGYRPATVSDKALLTEAKQASLAVSAPGPKKDYSHN